MELARVIGRVVATVKYPTLEGVRMLVIQPQDADGTPQGEPIVACDAVQAGPGDLVKWITGREAALALPNTFAPVDCTITGIVDHAWRDPKHLTGAR
jgi:ethanolamine utilization protein EutN